MCRFVRLALVATLLAVLGASGAGPVWAAPAVPADQGSPQGTAAEPAAAAQGLAGIALQDNKKSAAYPKADWTIAAVIESVHARGAAAALSEAAANGLTVAGPRVRVIVEASDVPGAAAAVAATGATVEVQAGALIQVLASPDQISSFMAAGVVRYVRPPLPHSAEAVVDEGVTSTNALGLQQTGLTGAGVKVAVVDMGFAGLAAAQANGDLPASLTRVDDCSGGFGTATNHGTAVAEIVHKMAPDASLYLICIGTEVELAQAETYVKANGITIVNHSVAWVNSGRGDGTGGPGTPDATVADANANGILWVNAAGNDATNHWSGTFVSDGTPTHPWMLFAAGNIGNGFTLAAGATGCAYLKWDSWPYTAQDYDLFVIRGSDGAYVVSNNNQDGSQPPTESVCFTNDGATQTFFVAINRWNATASPRFDLYVWQASLQYQTAAGSVTEPASAPAAFAVGAVCWQASTIEPFSSRGPTIDGRMKPDISGPDQTSTLTYGPFSTCGGSGFSGTSASAPHVAGAAALVKGQNPTYTPAQLKSFLQTHAVDRGTPGADNTYGSGMLFLPSVPGKPTAVRAVSTASASATVSWTAPASNGGSTITGYTVTSSTDGKTCSWSSGPLTCTVSGLTNGTAYTFTARATSGVGTGPLSDPSNSVTPGAPDKPTGVIATRGDGAATVSWSAPADNGDAIIGYTVVSNPDGRTCAWSTGPLACTVSSLTNGTAYSFTATATNGRGTGPASNPSNSVAPAGLPGKPTGVAASPWDGAAIVTWAAAPTNGSPVIGYTVASNPDGRTCAWSTGPLACTVSSLTNGTAYSFTVTATNGVGTGSASDPSTPVTPTAATSPDAPTGVQAVGGSGSAIVSWSAATPNRSPIIHYTATASPGGRTCTWSSGALSCLITGLADGATYGITVTATNGVGEGPASSPAVSVTVRKGATYFPLTPSRILDTRDGTGGLSGPFDSRSARTFQVSGHGGVPAAATAVTGNLTVTGQTSNGYLFIGPVAMNNPTSSTLNFPVRDDRANAVTVALGAGGTLSITFASPNTSSTAQVIFDVTGYFMSDSAGATYYPLTPARILDSRDGTGGLGGAFSSHLARTFQVTGRGGVPSGATAVTGNLTVTGQSNNGFLFVGPIAMNNPTSSTLNFPVRDDRANAVTVALGGGGTLSITFAAPAMGKTAHVIFDVTGYFLPGQGGATYVALTPARILDSRDGTGGPGGAFSSHVARSFPVTGAGGVPSNATAITGNLTVTAQASNGFLFIGPIAMNNPTSSTLNFPVRDDRANGVTVALGAGGRLSVTYAAPTMGKTAHVVFDVTGYFLP